MSEKPPRPRPLRPLNHEERELWGLVTRAVRPLKPAGGAAPAAGGAVHAPAIAGRPARRDPPPLKELAPFEPRLKRQLARGLAAIDGTIDLHGLSLPRAHAALLAFIGKARSEQARVVLVITGKGGSREGHGVLRRQVPLWLRSPGMREGVLALAPAHANHGGEGALYVRLRRARRLQDEA